MSTWPANLDAALGEETRAVLVSVAEVRGSAPRESGTKMVVTTKRLLGTIGGGNLEYKAIEIARALLAEPAAAPTHRRFPLGPSLGQCCGGVAVLAFEPVGAGARGWLVPLGAALDARVPIARVARLGQRRRDGACDVHEERAHGALLVTGVGADGTLGAASLDAGALELARAELGDSAPRGARIASVDGVPVLVEVVRPPGTEIVVFGAGHVGKALVHVLGALPCRVIWVDPRAGEFPAAVPPNVEVVVHERPERLVARGPAGALWVIATHSHPLDFALVERVLARGDARYCGMIGSTTKRRRLERRLRDAGLDRSAIGRLTCPIGVVGIEGKHPGAIAVAVAAELLRAADARDAVPVARPGGPGVETARGH